METTDVENVLVLATAAADYFSSQCSVDACEQYQKLKVRTVTHTEIRQIILADCVENVRTTLA